MNITISAVIPCLNEEKSLGICIQKCLNAFENLGINGEVVIGDNGSTDNSVKIAESLGARVIHQPIRGYGAAIIAATNAAQGEYIIMGDADDSYDWSNLGSYLEKLEEGHDIVMGNRFGGTIHKGAMPFLHKYLGNPVLSWISRKLYDSKVSDFHCGMRGFTQSAWKRMNPVSPGMEFATEMLVNASRLNLDIAEIPIDLHPDKRDRPPHLRTFRDGWRHLRYIVANAPNFLYLIPASILVLSGLLIQAALFNGPIEASSLYFGIHYLALGLLLFLTGTTIFSLGIISKLFLTLNGLSPYDRISSFIINWFTLEKSIFASLILFFIGFGIDVHILIKYLNEDGPMQTTHQVFVGTGLIAAAAQLFFTSFLVYLMLDNKKS